MNTEIAESERAALEVLRSTGIDVLKAALVAKEALECERGRVRRARECVRLGAEEMRKRERTVTFAKSVEIALEDRKRKGLRARSIVDFRYLCKRMMKMNPGLAERRMWSVTSGDCRRYLETAFGGSAAQYRKARAILSGVFATAIRHDWCDSNPVSRVEVPEVVEKSLWIYNLRCTIYDLVNSRLVVKRTISASEWRCVPGGTFSLGFQPVETVGGRVVPLRKAAGWGKETAHPWRQDVCRHTFATYHAAHFRNFPALQLEMGHRDSSLRRTRYVYAGNGTEASARTFFECTMCNVQIGNNAAPDGAKIVPYREYFG